ncbi:MAG: EAL domain-containing protein [Clostridia bacterium]|nr:EAL domain-containing protein [Clostridia bacterium]
MRSQYAWIFIFQIVALSACTFLARRSNKTIGSPVALVTIALIMPIIGNLLLVVSHREFSSTIGCYVYFLGMDLMVYAMLRFAFAYCYIRQPKKWVKIGVALLLLSDVAQMLCNPIFHHAFGTQEITVDGAPYFQLIPYAGQMYHRVVCYGVFAAVLVIFCVKLIRSPRIYAERYSVILFTLLAACAWQTYYIFSGTPVDRSMISFGVVGLLVFYFSLYYRPMKLLDRMLANIASNMPEAMFFFDASGRCIWANNPGMALTDVRDNDFDQAGVRLGEIFGDIGQDQGDWSSRRVLALNDAVRHYVLERHEVEDKRNRLAGSFLSVRDNTDEQKALLQQRYAATHDSLTGLYTREFLYEEIRRILSENPDVKYMVAFVDIKDFKIVNDIFGADFGDYALKCLADWIQSNMSDNCVYGRLSGDTFGVCRPVSEFDPEMIEEQLSGFTVNDGSREHNILVHPGVYEITESGLDVSVMFDRAHLALSTIKDEYKNHIAYYDDAMRSRVLWNKHITGQLTEALAQRQVRPYLQPIVDERGRVVGAEALVRWIHPIDGFLPPSAFIPVFEENGMIAEVDRFMWRSACEILARWKQAGCELFISVNISPKDFYFMNVADEIRGIVAEYGVDPARLRIEITETVMMTDIEHRVKMLGELRQAGFMVELDDFGSGYSSLNMLKDMPVDVLKVDMMFVKRSQEDDKSRTILRSVFNLSNDLGIVALTEGVETQPQFSMLTDMGCRLFQGYYFARPMPVDQFESQCLPPAPEKAGEDPAPGAPA